MPVDRRTLILDALWTLLQAVPDITTYARNRGELTRDDKPSLIMLDGHEYRNDSIPVRMGRDAVHYPDMMVLRPQIFVTIQNREPMNVGVGAELAQHRFNIFLALEASVDLASAVTTNGKILVEGVETDLATGLSMTGQMQVLLALMYPLMSKELEG